MGPNAVGNKRFTEEYILQRALANLEKLDVIGLTEEMNRMILQVSCALSTISYRPSSFALLTNDALSTVEIPPSELDSKGFPRV